MSVLLPTVEVGLLEIDKRLRETVQRIEAMGYLHAIESNVLILVPDDASGKESLEELTKLIPGRFFVLSTGPRAEGAAITAVCHSASSSATVCSDIIRLTVHSDQFEGLPSLLRAHFLPTAPLHLFILDPDPDLQLLKTLTTLAETLYIDSSELVDPVGLLAIIDEGQLQVVDLQWLFLAPWRESIKSSFDRHSLIERLPSIEKIVIKGQRFNKGPIPASMLLLASWMAARLHLSLESALTPHNIILTRETGERVRLEFVIEAGKSEQIDAVTLFSSSSPLVELVRQEGERSSLEATIHDRFEMKVIYPFEDLSKGELLARYFLVGESTINYCRASRLAVELLRAISRA